MAQSGRTNHILRRKAQYNNMMTLMISNMGKAKPKPVMNMLRRGWILPANAPRIDTIVRINVKTIETKYANLNNANFPISNSCF